MRLAFTLLTVCCSFHCHQLAAQELVRRPEKMIIAPSSGGVDIEGIKIVRWAALGAVKEADLTNMRVSLLLTAAWERQELPHFYHLVRLHTLSPIEDNTGRLLSTEKRLKNIEYLQGEVRGQQWYATEDKAGPSIDLLLDAPERSAVKIKAIRGKAEVLRARAIPLQFDDLSAISGTELSHPDMHDLKNLKLRFSIEAKDKEVTAKLSAPFNYASPWFQGRLKQWTLRDGKGEIDGLSRRSTSAKNGGVTVERTYRRRDFEGWSLHLVVLEPVESKTFDFEFENVELP